MTTIGYAVLQIVPSLRGVSEAVEKELAGKAVSVSIEPKVDQKAADAAGKKTREVVEGAAKDIKVEPKVQPKVDKSTAEKAGKDTAAQTKVEPTVEPKVDSRTASSVGTRLGTELGRQVGEAAIRAGATAARNIDNAIKQEGFVGAARKIGSSITNGLRNIGPAAGKVLSGGLGQAATIAAPTVLQKLNDALANGMDKVGDSGIANKLVGGLDTAQTQVSSFVDGATSSLEGFSSVLDDVEGLLGPDSFAAPGIDALRDGLAKATPLMDAMSATTKVATGVQGAFNLVMRANPIGMVITALTGLVGGLTWFFTKTELGQQVWEKFTEYLKVAWDWIKAAFETGWNIIKPIFTGWIDTATKVWETVRDNFNNVVGFVKELPGKISNAAKGMWEGLKSGLKNAINWIIDKINSLTGGLSNVMSKIPGVTVEIPQIPRIGEFATGGYTGALPVDQIAGVVHGGEYVIKKDSTTRIENAFPGLLDFLNKRGELPGLAGYADGGLVAGTSELRKIIADRFGIGTIYGYRGEDGYGEHSTGRALDVMVGNDKATGDAVKDFAIANASAIDLKWAIWQQRLWYPDGTSQAMEDRGDPTQNHFDHVHIFSGPGITNGLLGQLSTKNTASTSGDEAGTDSSASSRTAPDTSTVSPMGTAGSAAAASAAGAVGGADVPSSLSGFGAAAGEFIDGQVSSALGVFGIPDSPGWLEGVSKFVGGLSISDASGNKIFDGGSAGGAYSGAGSLLGNAAPSNGYGGAAPAVPAPVKAATVPAGAVHGAQAGQPPGPVFNTTIQARDAEDALDRWKRNQNEIAAKGLSRLW